MADVKLYFHDAASDANPAPAAPTVDYAWSGFSTLKSMSTSIGSAATTATNNSNASTSTKKYGIRRFAYGPLATDAFVNIQGFGLSFGTQQANANASFSACSRFRIFIWRPSSQTVVKTLWDNTNNGGPSAWYIDPDFGDYANPIQGIDTYLTGTSVWRAFMQSFNPGGSYYTARTNDSSYQGQNASAADIADGDYLVVEFISDVTQAAASSYQQKFVYDGTAEATASDCAAFILFKNSSLPLYVPSNDKTGSTTVSATTGMTTPGHEHEGQGTITATATSSVSVVGSAVNNRNGTTTVSATGSVSSSGRHVVSHTVSVSASAAVYVTTPAKDNALDVEISYAAFGGTDPYSSAKFTAANKASLITAKGVITRPGDRFIGKRVDIGKNDRVFFHVSKEALIGDASHLARRVRFFVTPVHVLTWDRSALVSEDLFKVRRVDTTLDLETCTASAALAATLSGDYGTITAENIWLGGGGGMPIPPSYASTPRGKAIDPWEIDLTSLYNDALTNAKDLSFCLECVATSDKTVVELFGTEHPLLRPKLEVQKAFNGNIGDGSGIVIDVNDVDSCIPSLVIRNSAGGGMSSVSVVKISYGYDDKFERDITHHVVSTTTTAITVQMPPLEPAARVGVRIDLSIYDGSDQPLRYERTFKTPKAPAAKLTLPTRVYSWQAVRGPCSIDTPGVGEAYVVLAKSGGGTGEPPAGTWRFWRATNYAGSQGPANPPHGAHVFMPIVGGSQLAGLGDSPDPDQIAASHPLNELVDFTADDVSAPFYDFSNYGTLYFLRSDYNSGTGKYDIKLVEVSNTVGVAQAWFTGFWHDGFRIRTSPALYSATAAPNLKLAAIARDTDWRTSRSQMDFRGTVVVAFVADGNLKILEQSSYVECDAVLSGHKYPGLDLAGTWTTAYNAATTIDSDLALAHTLTVARAGYLVLFGMTSSGNGTLARRSQDTFTYQTGSGDYVRSGGTWYVNTGIPNFVTGYAAQPFDLSMNGAAADQDTSAIVVISSGGVAHHYRTVSLVLTDIQPQLAPQNYGPGDQGFSPSTQLVEAWPTSYSRMLRTSLGGGVGLRVASGVLYAQRITDLLRVSAEKSVTLDGSVTGTEIHGGHGVAWEGQPAPVIVGSSGAYQACAVGTCVDVARIDAPTIDLVAKFSTGKMTVDNFQAPQSNMHLTGLHKVPGHNAFAMTWFWDPDSYDYMLMNNAGTFQFKLTGVLGETLRLFMHNAASNAAFVGGQRRPAMSDWTQPGGTDGSSGESLGGKEWPFVKWDTWYYTYDPPGTPSRTWRRIFDKDYVLDGESGGGIEILQPPPFTANDVWISHDMAWDPTHWKALVTLWLSRSQTIGDTAYGKVSHVNANGELLHDNGQVASQVFQDVNGRYMTTWKEGASTTDNGAGSNFLGMMISDSGYARSAKRLIMLQATEDAEEQIGGNVLPTIVNELLSGSSLAHTLLRQYDFVLIPFQNQVGAERGFSRYQYDTRREGTAMVHHEPGEPYGEGVFLWQGESYLGAEFQTKWIEMWATDHPNPTDCVFGDCKFHADVPNRDLVGVGGVVEYSAPFAEIGWDIPRFRGQFDAFVQPEFFAPTGSINGGGYDSVCTALNQAVSTRGGVSFYFELPWRALSHKAGYWWEDDAVTTFAYAFMKGIGGVAGWDLFSPDIAVSAAASVAVTGVQGKHVDATTAMSGTASLTTTGEQGKVATATTAIAGTGAITTTGLAQFPGVKYGSTAITGVGSLVTSGLATLSPDRFGATALTSAGILTTTFTGTGVLVRAKLRLHVSI